MSGAGVPGLSPGGWVFMIGAWGLIIALSAFCFLKILRRRGRRE